MSDSTWDLAALLRRAEALQEHPALVPVAKGVFEYTQVLLDDEDNLTRVGNLNADARALLRARTEELLSGQGEVGEEDPELMALLEAGEETDVGDVGGEAGASGGEGEA